MKKLQIILAITIVHFFTTVFLVRYAFFKILEPYPITGPEYSLWKSFLLIVTKIISFPIYTFKLHQNELFKDVFELIPMFINSLIWATAIYLTYIGAKKVIAPNKSLNQTGAKNAPPG